MPVCTLPLPPPVPSASPSVSFPLCPDHLGDPGVVSVGPCVPLPAHPEVAVFQARGLRPDSLSVWFPGEATARLWADVCARQVAGQGRSRDWAAGGSRGHAGPPVSVHLVWPALQGAGSGSMRVDGALSACGARGRPGPSAGALVSLLVVPDLPVQPGCCSNSVIPSAWDSTANRTCPCQQFHHQVNEASLRSWPVESSPWCPASLVLAGVVTSQESR